MHDKDDSVGIPQPVAEGRARAELHDERVAIVVEDSKVSADDDEGLCIICFEAPSSHILIPCGHQCVCQSCMDKVLNECPICRAAVDLKVKVFKV